MNDEGKSWPPGYRRIAAYDQPVDGTIGIYQCGKCGRLMGEGEGDVCYGGEDEHAIPEHEPWLFVRQDLPKPDHL